MTKTEKNLGKIESEIGKTSFLNGKGLGNEVSYYVFDYDPKDEILVREYIDKLVKKDKEFGDGYKLKVYDVYDLMIDLLESEGYLEDCFEMEKNDGMNYLVESVNDLLRMSDNNDYFTEYIEENTPEKAIVFLTGVGKIFPFVRSHKILNNLHQSFNKAPVVMFYPGKYDGQSLELFGEFKDDNYYRAFPLIK
ncbi:hypothetical protein JCM16775_0152 [Leptotrichia hofstadii]|uniref:Cytoplasmic protein n=1 Tax=Leptotrichia hofstadii TaxID=157688 RepID=A0A510JE33_9FUSO|nr:DUF1788 domain-containing protein [Leptotrichia hofstadii]BBM37477.1 hypothetical protein JCM16775_0152 [Leptotrichia hofstadii]